MLRAFAMFGLGGGFLMISPKLRMTVETGLDAGITYMSLHSPWSYCGVVVVALVFAGFTLYCGAQPR